MPRKRHVSRNEWYQGEVEKFHTVMPRKRHVSRNFLLLLIRMFLIVMPRKRHVSRNVQAGLRSKLTASHASQEACE